MSANTVPALPDEETNPAALLQTLLDVSLTGIILFRPVYDAPGQQLVDFAYERLNPAAQRLLQLPEHPAGSLLTQYPAAAETGVLAFYREALASGQLARHQFQYQQGGQDGYFQLVAQRQGPLLVVSFTDTDNQPRSVVEQALRESQAQQQLTHQQVQKLNEELATLNEELRASNEEYQAANAALTLAQHELAALNDELEARVLARTQELRQAQADTELQRVRLEEFVMQTPALRAVLGGPNFVYELVNPPYQQLFTGRQLLGRPLAEALPDLADTATPGILERVYRTGQPYDAGEVQLPVVRTPGGPVEQHYFSLLYQPRRSGTSQVDGILVYAADITEQVLARQRVQELNEELSAALAEARHQRGQLREQQGLLSQILGQVPAAIATLSGPGHQYTFFNEPYQHLSGGRTRMGLTVADVLPEVVEQGFIALLDRVYATGEPFSGEGTPAFLYDATTGQPEQHFVDFTYQPLLDGQQQVQGILAFIVDVTERVLARRQATTMQAAMLGVAQRQAYQRQELFQVFEQTPVAIVLLREPDHRIDYFNPAFEELFPPDEWQGGPLHGHTIGQVYPRIREAGLVALLDRVYETGESQSVLDMPLAVLQPGSPRYITFAYQAYREGGQIVGVAAFVYDTTDQVLARQRQEAQQAELQRVFEQTPVAIAIMRGPELRIELANAAMAAIWGRSSAQTVGRPYFEALPDTAGQGFEEILTGVMQTGESFLVTEAPAQLARAHTGLPTLGYFNFIFQPLYDEQRRISGLIAMGTEVTEQVLARQRVQELNQELAATNGKLTATNDELHDTNTHLTRTNADLDTFVYSASHDLKSPITNIEGLLLALREELPPAAQQTGLLPQLLSMMDEAVRRFQQTLGHLTDVSRLQQSLFDQNAEAVDLSALVEAVRLDILPELTAANATLTVEVTECPKLYFSAKNLRSILYNLLSNAVKYRDPARPALVQLRCHPTGSEMVLQVQDNGLGLSEMQQRELFQLFRRLHTHVPGSGVGLYMVKKMVDNTGGTLTVQSQPGLGSTFTVTLPTPNRP